MKKIVLICLFFASMLAAKELSSESVIKSMIDAYGGKKKIEQLNAYTQVWDIETKTSDINGTDHRTVLMPDSLRTELVYPNKKEIRLLIKNSGIKQFDNSVQKAQGPMLDAMKLQFMRIYNPLILEKKLNSITLLPTDGDHYILKLIEKGLSTEYVVSKKNYLIDKVIGTLKMGGTDMQFVTYYKDYKPVNGVMAAHKEIKYAGSVNTAIMRLKKMKFVKKSEIKLF